MCRFLTAAIAVAAVAMLAAPARAADAEQGGVLAKRWCAACHVVAADQVRGSTQAPPFSEIARKPGFDAGQLALYLLLPHPRAEAADLAAYIAAQH